MRQKLGQHFLTNEAVLAKIAEALHPQMGEAVIEIGPGHGELTNFLPQKNLVLLERDPSLIADLQINFPRVKIVEGNALETLPQVVTSLKNKNYKLCGNLPYYLTGHLLRVISELEHKPKLSVFTIQKEVAERIASKAPEMNRLAAAVQFWAEPKIVGLISRRDFAPPPEVDSATIALTTKIPPPRSAESNGYYEILHILFAQPRKTIGNNLFAAGWTREDIQEKLDEIGMDPKERPQNLTVEAIAQLAEFASMRANHSK